LRQLRADLDLAITPGGLAPRRQPRRGEFAGGLRARIGSGLALRFGQSRAGEALAPRGDDQLAIDNRGIRGPRRIALPLVIAAAPAIDIEAPFGRVYGGLPSNSSAQTKAPAVGDFVPGPDREQRWAAKRGERARPSRRLLLICPLQ
jgi:hypothetical protein